MTGIHAAAALSKVARVRIISPNPVERKLSNVKILEGYTIVRISGKPRSSSIEIKTPKGEIEKISCDSLLISMGRMSKNIILKYSSAKLREEDCGVIHDEKYMSSILDVFVTGDALRISESPEEHIRLSRCVANNAVKWAEK